jgi:hypothetical protein
MRTGYTVTTDESGVIQFHAPEGGASVAVLYPQGDGTFLIVLRPGHGEEAPRYHDIGGRGTAVGLCWDMLVRRVEREAWKARTATAKAAATPCG